MDPLDLPIPPPAFASVDGFLGFQREAVAAARAAFEEDADRAWERLPIEGRDRFVQALLDRMVEHGTVALWRRAWWLHAIGGQPRAPFDIATPPPLAAQLARALAQALAPARPPPDRPAALERWWRDLLALCRVHIGEYAAERVAGAALRLVGEGLLDQAAADTLTRDRRISRPVKPPRRPLGEVDRRRVRAAELVMVETHRSLDRRFAGLGPVCGACTRETGGCCSLTVPLLWREADYRLLAMGTTVVPTPRAETAGLCPFLGDQGCRLPSERRPHVCRSFLCDRAQAALEEEKVLPQVRADLGQLNEARSRLG